MRGVLRGLQDGESVRVGSGLASGARIVVEIVVVAVVAGVVIPVGAVPR
jgi:hypothetical protein